jgi:peptidoglycan/xylan/chitin deacetylase (PgdA/CDA1 family)
MPAIPVKKLTIVLLVTLMGVALQGCKLPIDRAQASPSARYASPAEEKPQGGMVSEFESMFASWSSSSGYNNSDTVQTEIPSNNPNYIYLTFDDGPDPKWTPQIISLLVRHKAVGTFFVIGRSAVTYPELILQEAQAGQMIANHGYNHMDLTTLNYGNFLLEVKDTERAVRDAISAYPELSQNLVPCLRPPYGAVNDNVWTFAYRIPYDVSMWTLDTNDWTGLPAESILDNVLTKAKAGSVVLMHDGGKDRSETVKALGLILHEMTLSGWEFRPMCTAAGQQAPSW